MTYTAQNEHITNNFFNNRIIILISLIIFTLTILLFRISFLQIIKSKKLIQKSDLRSSRIQIKLSKRGNIRDRLGNLLAISIPVKNICIDPKIFFSKKKNILLHNGKFFQKFYHYL